MKFKVFISEASKAVLKLSDKNEFLNYPKNIILDLEDRYGKDCIIEYEIDDNKVFITFGKNIQQKDIQSIIASLKQLNK